MSRLLSPRAKRIKFLEKRIPILLNKKDAVEKSRKSPNAKIKAISEINKKLGPYMVELSIMKEIPI